MRILVIEDNPRELRSAVKQISEFLGLGDHQTVRLTKDTREFRRRDWSNIGLIIATTKSEAMLTWSVAEQLNEAGGIDYILTDLNYPYSCEEGRDEDQYRPKPRGLTVLLTLIHRAGLRPKAAAVITHDSRTGHGADLSVPFHIENFGITDSDQEWQWQKLEEGKNLPIGLDGCPTIFIEVWREASKPWARCLQALIKIGEIE